ncbi:aldo/keto reductase [Brevundimonas sp.]|uniref:aldo/keto reductase n=1 Tax=Brevundimonas sp. TaxID=1871086 RepID=UPI00344BB6F5
MEVLTAIAAERAVAPAAIALSWLFTQRPHLRAIPGARHPAQVRDFASAQDLRLSADDLERLRRVTSQSRP